MSSFAGDAEGDAEAQKTVALHIHDAKIIEADNAGETVRFMVSVASVRRRQAGETSWRDCVVDQFKGQCRAQPMLCDNQNKEDR